MKNRTFQKITSYSAQILIVFNFILAFFFEFAILQLWILSFMFLGVTLILRGIDLKDRMTIIYGILIGILVPFGFMYLFNTF